MDIIYVMPFKGVWALKKEAEEEPVSVYETKDEAIKKANEMVQDSSHVVILAADGTIENPDTYSIEPLLEDDKENNQQKSIKE